MTALPYIHVQSPIATMIGVRWFYIKPFTIDDLPFALRSEEAYSPWELSLIVGLPFVAIGIVITGSNPYAQ